MLIELFLLCLSFHVSEIDGKFSGLSSMLECKFHSADILKKLMPLQGAKVPPWMTPQEWEVTHPGFASSVPSEHANKTELCEGIVLLGPDTFFNEGESEVTIEYVIKEHVLKPVDTVYDHVRFNFPVSLVCWI